MTSCGKKVLNGFDIDSFLDSEDADFAGEHPPVSSDEELRRLDSEAMVKEVEKLTSLDVVEHISKAIANLRVNTLT